MHPALVTPEWVLAHGSDPGVVIIDASWYLPQAGRNPKSEYLQERIEGAVFFDLDAISDQATSLPHMLPSPEVFSEAVGNLGIGDDSTVVIYDTAGIFSAPRVWWMFRVFGLSRVSVLEGGLVRWKREGKPLASGAPLPPVPKKKTPFFDPSLIADKAQVLSDIIETGTAQLIDARSVARFWGEEPEPRPGVRKGHIPGAKNLPYGTLLTTEGTFKPLSELEKSFQNSSIDLTGDIITSCGSGVTAAILSLALYELDRTSGRTTSRRIYDGSWAEWGSDETLPIEGKS